MEEELRQGSDKSGASKVPGGTLGSLASALGLGVVFVRAFSLTFLAEWGDRSQLATITLAADSDPLGVTLGGVVGHALCTGLAVLGGRAFASAISERVVLLAGGALFLLFGAQSALEAYSSYLAPNCDSARTIRPQSRPARTRPRWQHERHAREPQPSVRRRSVLVHTDALAVATPRQSTRASGACTVPWDGMRAIDPRSALPI